MDAFTSQGFPVTGSSAANFSNLSMSSSLVVAKIGASPWYSKWPVVPCLFWGWEILTGRRTNGTALHMAGTGRQTANHPRTQPVHQPSRATGIGRLGRMEYVFFSEYSIQTLQEERLAFATARASHHQHRRRFTTADFQCIVHVSAQIRRGDLIGEE